MVNTEKVICHPEAKPKDLKMRFFGLRPQNDRSVYGFTLVEVLVAFAIFTVITGIVLLAVSGMFRSLRQAQIMLQREQKERLCLYRLGREVSSVTRITYPELRFKGEEKGFFLSTPRRVNSLKSIISIAPQRAC